jgi:6 kDa early secretory antigenic target
VSQAAADCGTVSGHITQQLDELKSYLAPLVGTWTGEASEHYRALEQQWERSAADLNAVLGSIQKALDNVYQNYVAAESANTKIWG